MTVSSSSMPAEVKSQANNLMYLLLGVSLARWNSEISSGKERHEFNLFLGDSPVAGIVRQLGQRLHDLGGFGMMNLFVHNLTVTVPEEDPGIDRRMMTWVRTELNVAWDGIGDWQA